MGYGGAGTVDIKTSFSYPVARIAGRDDQVGLAVHEAAGLVGLDLEGGSRCGGSCLKREGLDGRRSLAKLVDEYVGVCVVGAVDGENVGDGLRGVRWEVLHACCQELSCQLCVFVSRVVAD